MIKKGTMEGLVRHLLLNPAGEQLPHIRALWTDLLMDADMEQHDTFFIGHPAFISSQDVLAILIRQFDEGPMRGDEMRAMKLGVSSVDVA